MQAEEFKRLALDIYGAGWANQLASVLRINDRTVRDMANGKRNIPTNAADLLTKLHTWHKGVPNG